MNRNKRGIWFCISDSRNEFYAYYLYKVTGDVDAASKEEKTRKAAAVAAALMSKKGLSFGGAAAAAAVTGNNLDKGRSKERANP